METENIEIDLPMIGKISGDQIEQYLPVYLRLRKDRDIKSMIPKEIDEKIMGYASLIGAVDPEPQRLEEIEIPLSELNESIDIMLNEGYSQTQIAARLDIYPTVVSKRVAHNKEIVSEVPEDLSKKNAELQEKVDELVAKIDEWEPINSKKTSIMHRILKKLNR